MEKEVVQNTVVKEDSKRENERGSAIVISLFILALITVFVALALSRSSSEAFAVGNETGESRTFYAAQGSLETMTRNFNKKFEVNLKPTSVDFNDVRTSAVPGLSTSVGGLFTFDQEVLQTSNNAPVVLTDKAFSGLYAKRDNWRLRTTATDNVGIQVQLTRNVLNNLVPIFQFGIFYDDDLEFHPGPRFDFGGRVHSNGSLFMQANTGVYFSSKVTTANFIYTDVSKNGSPWTNWDDNVWVRNASGTYVQLQYNMGSVLASPVNGAPVVSTPAPSIPLPTAYNSASWNTNKALFDGNLVANSPSLQLPLKLNSDNTSQNLGLREVIKRGKNIGDMWNNGTGTVAVPNITPVPTPSVDDGITASERYYNKTGIRISLADSKAKLPGCATGSGTAVATACGIRLDGDSGGTGTYASGARGYQPLSMVGTPAYQATKINGERFNSGNSGPNAKESWIKIETVIYNAATESYDKEDITADILALGVTERAPNVSGSFQITDSGYNSTYGTDVGVDSRSILRLQRYAIAGTQIPSTVFMSSVANGLSYFNFVAKGSVASGNCNDGAVALSTTGFDTGTFAAATYFPAGFAGDSRASMRNATIGGTANRCVVPFPINMFDTREGLYNDSDAVFNPTDGANYGSNVPWNGVMSMVDINVGNLKKFLDGAWDTSMPIGTPYHTATGHVLRGNDIPQPTNSAPKSGGWVVYVSDRRGDYDFDGEYDMEDVYGNNDGVLQVGEDLNGTGTLQAAYTNEAPRYTGAANYVAPEIAAVFDHKYYRRGVRLVNGSTIPGIYNTTTPENTRGFTFASENGVYVQGNYNATGISTVGTPTASTDYLPLSTSAADIPASVVGDSITILSNSWADSTSFSAPFNHAARPASETTIRFAMLSGDTLTSSNGTPNQGGSDPKMNGGVHNFKRFLENWGGNRLNYSGSLINLFNSANNNGTFKCCNHVYSPPNRNWVFDATFLDINRLPPGTPYFQYVQTTGFQRTND